MSSHQKEQTQEVIDYMFCTLCMVCLGRAVCWDQQDYNWQSMQQVQNTCLNDWTVSNTWTQI